MNFNLYGKHLRRSNAYFIISVVWSLAISGCSHEQDIVQQQRNQDQLCITGIMPSTADAELSRTDRPWSPQVGACVSAGYNHAEDSGPEHLIYAEKECEAGAECSRWIWAALKISNKDPVTFQSSQVQKAMAAGRTMCLSGVTYTTDVGVDQTAELCTGAGLLSARQHGIEFRAADTDGNIAPVTGTVDSTTIQLLTQGCKDGGTQSCILATAVGVSINSSDATVASSALDLRQEEERQENINNQEAARAHRASERQNFFDSMRGAAATFQAGVADSALVQRPTIQQHMQTYPPATTYQLTPVTQVNKPLLSQRPIIPASMVDVPRVSAGSTAPQIMRAPLQTTTTMQPQGLLLTPVFHPVNTPHQPTPATSGPALTTVTPPTSNQTGISAEPSGSPNQFLGRANIIVTIDKGQLNSTSGTNLVKFRNNGNAPTQLTAWSESCSNVGIAQCGPMFTNASVPVGGEISFWINRDKDEAAWSYSTGCSAAGSAITQCLADGGGDAAPTQ